MIVVTQLPYGGKALAFAAREIVAALAAGDAAAIRWGLMAPPPPLYTSGVVYRPEPTEGEGLEEWADPWTVAQRGWGDCDDLVRYRLRELWEAGVTQAFPAVANDSKNWTGTGYHIAIRLPDGGVDDPAKRLKR